MAMLCQDFFRDVDCFLDGELLSQDRQQVESHLRDCDTCRKHLEARQQLRRALRSTATPCPANLRQNLSQKLDFIDAAQPVPGYFRRISQKPHVMLLAGAAAGLLILPLLQDKQTEQFARTKTESRPMVEAMISRHQLPLPLDVTGEPEKVQSWFAGKVPFYVPAPKLEPVASLQGGRLADLGDREAVLLRYQRSGRPISVYIFDPRGLELSAPRRIVGNREVFMQTGRGYQVAVFRDRGLGYAITSELNEPDHLKLVNVMMNER